MSSKHNIGQGYGNMDLQDFGSLSDAEEHSIDLNRMNSIDNQVSCKCNYSGRATERFDNMQQSQNTPSNQKSLHKDLIEKDAEIKLAKEDAAHYKDKCMQLQKQLQEQLKKVEEVRTQNEVEKG